MKIVILISVVTAFLFLSGCAGTVKTYDKETGKKTGSTPAGVAVMQAGIEQIKNCPKNKSYGMDVSKLTQLSASAQAEAVSNVPMMMALEMLKEKNGGGNCYTAVAGATQEYFKAQAVKYQQLGIFGRGGLVGIVKVLRDKYMFGAFGTASAKGDTAIGEVNISGSGAGGASGEGTGGLGRSTMITNVGAGNSINTLATGAQINNAEKQILAPVTGGGDSNPALDDSGDGSGNQAGINPFGQ